MEEYFPASYAPERKPPLWARLTGKRHWDSSYRYSWGEFDPKFVGIACKVYCYEEPGIILAPGVFRFFVKLPRWRWIHRLFSGDCGMENESYGFSFAFKGEWAMELHVAWGKRSKHIRPPWGWSNYQGEYLGTDGEFYPNEAAPDYFGRRIGGFRSSEPLPPEGPEPWVAVWPYHYMTDQGEAQHVNATVKRKRSTRTWKLFGIPIRKRVSHDIDVSFDQEVGNQRGSWKGGTVGCGYSMKAGETPFRTLRRMQAERRFDR